jgi:SET domain-containing protein
MPKRPFRVGRSRTGLGLFATEPIKKRTLIAYYVGQRIDNDEAIRREDKGGRYLYEINSRWTIDGKSRRNLARYANHSCRPNAESDVVRGGKITIRAIRNIEPGDEITYDYGRDYLRNVIGLENCQCVKCREKRAEERRVKRAKARRAAARKAKLNGHAKGKLNGHGKAR